MVARSLLKEPFWPSLKRLVDWLQKDGADLSTAQASKAVHALEEDLLVYKIGGAIKLHDPLRLLDKLASEWRKPEIRSRVALRLPEKGNWPAELSSDPLLRWAVTGESSASHYLVFSQAGPTRIAVSDLNRAIELLHGTPEPITNFADVELIETEEPGFFFQTVADRNGVRRASRLQTWLELQAGDGRQRDAAIDLRSQILSEALKT
jgi:hypothetical protein